MVDCATARPWKNPKGKPLLISRETKEREVESAGDEILFFFVC